MNLIVETAAYAATALAPFVYGLLALWAALCALVYVVEHLRSASVVYRFWFLCVIAGCLAGARWTLTYDNVRPPDLLIMAGVAGLMTCKLSRFFARGVRRARRNRSDSARRQALLPEAVPSPRSARRRVGREEDVSRDSTPDAA